MRPEAGALHVFDDATALARGAAEWLTARAVATRAAFVVALSGGSTPKPLYEHLARAPLATRFPWDRTHFFIGDERFVETSDPASNFGMILNAMLMHVPVPEANVHPVPTHGLTLAQASDAYQKMLEAVHGGTDLTTPLFDVTFLGLGDDGHTASLLPGQPVLDVTDRWVAGVEHGRAEQRVTLTYPALNASRAIAFLVAGPGKREIVARVLAGGADVPAARLDAAGEVHWFLDRAAAGDRA